MATTATTPSELILAIDETIRTKVTPNSITPETHSGLLYNIVEVLSANTYTSTAVYDISASTINFTTTDTGLTYSVTGITDTNTYTTGGTYITSASTITFNDNTGGEFSVTGITGGGLKSEFINITSDLPSLDGTVLISGIPNKVIDIVDVKLMVKSTSGATDWNIVGVGDLVLTDSVLGGTLWTIQSGSITAPYGSSTNELFAISQTESNQGMVTDGGGIVISSGANYTGGTTDIYIAIKYYENTF